ncbi:MAG: hypothetical protein HYY01_00190 [Chloroflexi bacterium]|nr:hypothetical protein [Chloroflexota bacterium]
MNPGQFRWLVSQIRCSNCGQPLEASNVQLLGQQADLWFLNVFCGGCQTQALVAAMVRETAKVAEEHMAKEEPLTPDNGLDLHNFLKTFDGDFRTLFAQQDRRQRP